MKTVVLFLALALPGWCTWTMVQHQMNSSSGGPGTGTCTGSTTSCTVNVTAIGAGHLIICITHSTGGGMNPCTGDSGTWVHCANCSQTSSSLTIDAYYVLSAVGGGTTITCNFFAIGGFMECGLLEYSTNAGPPVFDTSNNFADTTCSPCAGVALTLTGTNDVIVQSIFPNANATAVGAPYGNGDFSGASGGIADRLNTNSGTAPSWTMGASDVANVNGIAFKETGAAAPTGIAAMSTPTNTPVFQKVGILVYFRRRRDYIRAWIQRRLRKPCLLDWMHPDGSPVFEQAPKELVKIFKQEHGG